MGEKKEKKEKNMLDVREKKIKIGDKEAILRNGEYALQANGSITLQCGETLVQAIVTMGDENPDLDFFPLTVEYICRWYNKIQ